MSDKKHIDRLFQEKFKDFETQPHTAVWERIEANLNEKNKKRRVIPIWWRYAGAAAILLLFLALGNFFFNQTESTSESQIVDIENPSEEKSDTTIANPINAEKQVEHHVANNNKEEGSKNKISETKTFPEPTPNNNISKHALVENQVDASKNGTEPAPNTKKTIINKNKHEALVNSIDENEFLLKANKIDETPIASIIEKPSLSDDDKTTIEKLEVKDEVENSINTPSENSIATNSVNEEPLVKKKQDNTSTIEEAIEKNKQITKQDNKTNRWSVAPNAAPVYFNTLGKGSSIDQQFNNNSKTGDVNMSYGISTSYAISKRIKVRSGINRVNLGYNTNNVVVFQYSGSSSSALKNINSEASNTKSDISITNEGALISESFSSSNTSLNQSLGYIEIPLEIQYSLSEKRFGVNIIGGFSSFFLNNNSVYTENENGQRTFLGEANNINDTSYSANFGIGLNYKFSKKIDLNLEPTFKYQFNTFSNTTGNFTPYFIGVYTGFAIKF